jgi:predicted metalloprotease with PDZ domain
MFHPRLFAATAFACVFSAWSGTADQAFAQPAIERVEAKLRERLLRPNASLDSTTEPEAVPAGKVVSPSTANAARPYLGITADDTNDRGRGVRVLQVHAGGPCARAGIQPQDLITAAAGQRVRTVAEMAETLEVLKPGDKLVLDIQRDKATKKIEVVLGQQPSASSPLPTAAFAPPAPATPPPPQPEVPVPDFPEIKPPQNDRSRIEQLERRIEALERRIEQLEKSAGKNK